MTEKQKFLRVFIGGFLFNGILIAGGVSFHLFFIRPAYATYRETNQNFAALEEQESSLQSSRQEVERRRDDFATLDAAFLNLDNAVAFVTLLESIASRSGVSLTIKSVTDTTAEIKKQAHFDLTVMGPFANSIAFLELVEHVPYFANISSLTISSQGGLLRTQLRLTVLTL